MLSGCSPNRVFQLSWQRFWPASPTRRQVRSNMEKKNPVAATSYAVVDMVQTWLVWSGRVVMTKSRCTLGRDRPEKLSLESIPAGKIDDDRHRFSRFPSSCTGQMEWAGSLDQRVQSDRFVSDHVQVSNSSFDQAANAGFFATSDLTCGPHRS
jgi:hypothetical protein